MARAARLKIVALGLVLAAIAGWLLVTQFVGHARVRVLRYDDRTAATGRLELPRRVSRTFGDRAPFAAYLRSRGALRVPSIDFGLRRAVLVAAGARSSSAFTVRVVRVLEERDRIVVSVRMHGPTLTRPGRPRLTFPYRLLALPAGSKPVHVEWLE